MDFISGMTLKEVGDALTTEGVGTAGGLVGGGFVGARSEDFFVKTPITAGSSLTQKVTGWAANNIPKVAVWYLMRRYDAATPLTADIKKGVMGSIVLDTIVRAGNHGAPTRTDILGFRILGPASGSAEGTIQSTDDGSMQKLIQENSALRAELNKAMSRLTTAPQSVATQTQVPAITVQQTPIKEKYGFMQDDRKKKYGFMGSEVSVGKMFGML